MSRPLSLPPFIDTPGSWLAQMRLRAQGPSGGPPSPEQIGAELGVSGATVRRWESGHRLPTDEDLVRFGKVCALSQHQIDFLRTVFTNVSTPLPPDEEAFRLNTMRRLTRRRAPMVLFDELMYARAWNSYVFALGPQVTMLLQNDVHPLEAFLTSYDCGDAGVSISAARVRSAIRSFWRFTAFFCGTASYKELVGRLRENPFFVSMWKDMAQSHDPAEIEISGVASLLMPESPKWTMLHSLVIYPPVYTLVEFEPDDQEAFTALKTLRDRSEPTVRFSERSHWSAPPVKRSYFPRAMGHSSAPGRLRQPVATLSGRP